MEKLRLALIGAWGRSLVSLNLVKEGFANLICIYDLYDDNIEKSKAYYDSFNIKPVYYKNLDSMLAKENIDAVFIGSPENFHKEHAIKCFKAKKAVYLEKPISINTKDADAILKSAQINNAKLFVGHNFRYYSVIEKMKELLDSGTIGNLQAIWVRHYVSYGGDAYFKDWHSERKNVNSLLIEKGCHDIDAIHYLANSYTEHVTGMGMLSVYNRNTNLRNDLPGYKGAIYNPAGWPPLNMKDRAQKVDVEDHSMVLMQLENGVQASYCQCMYTPDSERHYVLLGDRGKIENVGEYSKHKLMLYLTRTDKFREPDVVYHLNTSAEGHGGADLKIMKDFYNFVVTGKYSGLNPIDSRMAVACADFATRSLRNRFSPFKIPKLNSNIKKYFKHS